MEGVGKFADEVVDVDAKDSPGLEAKGDVEGRDLYEKRSEDLRRSMCSSSSSDASLCDPSSSGESDSD